MYLNEGMLFFLGDFVCYLFECTEYRFASVGMERQISIILEQNEMFPGQIGKRPLE